jgi:flagellar basal body rod protein FlgF
MDTQRSGSLKERLQVYADSKVAASSLVTRVCDYKSIDELQIFKSHAEQFCTTADELVQVEKQIQMKKTQYEALLPELKIFLGNLQQEKQQLAASKTSLDADRKTFEDHVNLFNSTNNDLENVKTQLVTKTADLASATNQLKNINEDITTC